MRWLIDRVKALMLRRGMVLSRPPGQFNLTDFKLAKARDEGLRIRTIIDGGAAEGDWAEELLVNVFPGAKVLCIEPRDEAQPALRARAQRLGSDKFLIAQTLVGATEGTFEFYEHHHQSSILPDSQGRDWGKKVVAPITTLDALVHKVGLGNPDLIKLDLQGAELEGLKGASTCLANAQAVLLEVSFIELQKGMPVIGQVIPFMTERGFRLYDILSLWQRPLDGHMAQGDFLFVADRSSLWADTRWSA